MSALQDFKDDMTQVKAHWKELHPAIRLLDLISIVSIGLFGIAFMFVYALDIPLIVTNVAFMMYPAILAGYTYVLRSKIAEDVTKINEAKKEYITNMLIITLIVLFTFVYASFFS